MSETYAALYGAIRAQRRAEEAGTMKHHLSICVETRYGRAGFVISGDDESKLTNWADTWATIGYCGNKSFSEAVKRAGMMERNEPGAWGPLDTEEPTR